MDTSRDALALDVVKAVGLRGHYLSQPHTRQEMHKREFSDLTSQPQEGGGFRNPIEVAREKTDWILENHHPQPLAEAQQMEFMHILKAAEGEFLD